MILTCPGVNPGPERIENRCRIKYPSRSAERQALERQVGLAAADQIGGDPRRARPGASGRGAELPLSFQGDGLSTRAHYGLAHPDQPTEEMLILDVPLDEVAVELGTY